MVQLIELRRLLTCKRESSLVAAWVTYRRRRPRATRISNLKLCGRRGERLRFVKECLFPSLDDFCVGRTLSHVRIATCVASLEHATRFLLSFSQEITFEQILRHVVDCLRHVDVLLMHVARSFQLLY